MHSAGQRLLRALVADDNDVNRRIMRALLSRARHEPTLVKNGAEALAAHIGDAPDLVILGARYAGCWR